MRVWMMIATLTALPLLQGCSEALIAGGAIAADEAIEDDL
jgi:hypothetical protein